MQRIFFAAACALVAAAPALAADPPHVHHMGAAADTSTAPSTPAPEADDAHEHHDHMHMGHDMAGMDMSGMEGMDHAQDMPGALGHYSMNREASATSWQPERSGHGGLHTMLGDWMLMAHGFATVGWDRAGGLRDDEKWISTNMGMASLAGAVGPGRLGLRAMMSAEPATIGKDGYPLLLQTGETADGRHHLIDRQHPHDLFMELAASYSVSDATRSAFVYAGLPGEPALGPPAFMHRFSGVEIPESPIGHHWLDSTHITYGVVTAGVVVDQVKVEASAFRGREPDQDRYDIEVPERLDSQSYRLSYNPTRAWAFQASFGHIVSPEQLTPEVDTDRITASVMYDQPWDDGRWQTTLAWGRNVNEPGHTLDAVLIETAASLATRHTLMGRAEWVQKDELFDEDDPRAGTVYHVGKFGAGYIFDVVAAEHAAVGIGAYGTVSVVGRSLRDAYGDTPASIMAFVRAKLR